MSQIKIAKNRAFKGIWLPAEMWMAPDINPIEKILWAEIDSLDNDDGCFASDQHFMDFFGIAKSTLHKYLQKLKEKGYIKVVDFDGRKRTIRSNVRLIIDKKNKSEVHERGTEPSMNVESGSTRKTVSSIRSNTVSNTVRVESNSTSSESNNIIAGSKKSTTNPIYKFKNLFISEFQKLEDLPGKYHKEFIPDTLTMVGRKNIKSIKEQLKVFEKQTFVNEFF